MEVEEEDNVAPEMGVPAAEEFAEIEGEVALSLPLLPAAGESSGPEVELEVLKVGLTLASSRLKSLSVVGRIGPRRSRASDWRVRGAPEVAGERAKVPLAEAFPLSFAPRVASFPVQERRLREEEDSPGDPSCP